MNFLLPLNLHLLKQLKFVHLILLSGTLIFFSCNKKEEIKEESKVRNDVLTEELQKAKTPAEIIEIFKTGNSKFVKGDLTFMDYPKQIMQTSKSQHPAAVVLSCLDSRIPVEKVFDLGVGDIFVARVAGNITNEDILASMEYACKVVGSKLILVLGHTDCGAVKSAIDKVKLGNITALLEKIQPAIDSLSDFTGDKSSKNKEFLSKVTDENVLAAMDNIRLNSPILKEMEDKKEIDIIGGVYDVNTGVVTFME